MINLEEKLKSPSRARDQGSSQGLMRPITRYPVLKVTQHQRASDKAPSTHAFKWGYAKSQTLLGEHEPKRNSNTLK